MALLSTAFCPPVEYFAVAAEYSELYIEAFGFYEKQSYRNRCRILTANGVESFGPPVVHGADLYGTPVKDVRVDYSVDWIGRFEYALESAYDSSPFFEYYRDGLFSILDSKPEKLLELNTEISLWIASKLGIAFKPEFTLEYAPLAPDDFRELIHPKKALLREPKPYWQVFRERFGFQAGLSSLDLLFCEGPSAICYL